ncbi:MAG: single-stranded DNA-binding protein [Angelakisella sp.]
MYNKAILIGRLTAEPELKTTTNSVVVLNFTVATDRPYKNGDGERKADFLNCTAWRQQAEFICKYFHKGDPIGVEGSIQTRSYEDKDGNKRIVVEIQTDNVFFVGGKKDGQSAPSTTPADEVKEE